MTEIRLLRQSARQVCGIARSLALTATLGLACAAQGQVVLPDPLQADLLPLLQSKDGETRGEAALALAAAGDAQVRPHLISMAQGDDEAARDRALLGLGLLAGSGAEAVLEAIRSEAPARSDLRRIATLALGWLPPEPRVVALDSWFNELAAASARRIEPELVCLLVGMLRHEHGMRAATLQALLEDATWRDRAPLGLAARVLAQSARFDPFAALEDLLRSRNPQLVHACLDALQAGRVQWSPGRRRQIAGVARRHKRPEVRIAALDLLCRSRQPEALQIAGAWLQEAPPAQAGAALRCLQRLGGRRARAGLEQLVLHTAAPGRRQTLLHAMRGPHSAEFLETVGKWAMDARLPEGLRREAALCMAEAGWKDISPLLITLFLEAEAVAPRLRLARALRSLKTPIADKLLPRADLRAAELLPQRLQALCLAEHPEATDLVRKILGDKDSPVQLRRAALRAYRVLRQPRLSRTDLALLPEGVRTLLEPIGGN